MANKQYIFTETGEVREPKDGEWFVNGGVYFICQAKSVWREEYRILKMEVDHAS